VSFSINTNVASLQAQNYLRTNSDFQSKTINRVTSGLRIIQSGDDAAGLAVANGLRSDQAVLTQGIRNANDGLSTLQTIDGGMGNISQLLDRARTLATQSASDTFTGDRSVLDGEFQNVLTEINRQAQSIGMISGGSFAKSMSVFIGGGRTNTSGTSAIVNGSVTLNLGNSLLDTTSLGLSANGVTGASMNPNSNALSNALGTGAGTQTFDFYVGGAAAAINVDFSSNFDTTHIKTSTDLVNALNTAIAAKAASSTTLTAANIRASVNSSGNLVFTSAQAFAVQAHGGAGGAADLLGNTTLNEVASSSIAGLAGGAVSLGTQYATFNWANSSGVAQSEQVTLGTSVAAVSDIVTAINTDSSLQGAGIFAVNNAGVIDVMKADGGAFKLSVAYDDSAVSAGGITPSATNTWASGNGLASSSAVDISNSSNATSAVTALSSAVANLGQIQGTVGRAENQLTYAMNLAQSQLTNEGTAESRIRDADLASEAANLTKAQILMQAGVAALAQANAAPQAVLSLLKG
jgi:flagellin